MADTWIINTVKQLTASTPLSRRHCLAACTAALGAHKASWGNTQPQITLRFSHVVAEETPKGLAANRFKVLVEQRSEGRIAVQVFPNGQLYGDNDEIQALQLGAVDLVAPSLSKFGRIGLPEFELFDLPFMFDNLAQVRRITQGALGQRLFDSLACQGLTGLGYFDNGFKQMSANRPLLAPNDFVGLRMRVQPSAVISAQMRALGARPVTLGFSETRQALAAGVVDGTENPVSNFWTQHMHEVQSHLSLTDHGYLGYAVVTNQRLWQHLSAPERQLIDQALQDALSFANQIADTQNDKALQALRDSNTTRIHTLTASQRDRLRQAVRPVQQTLTDRIGSNWLQSLRQALSSTPPG